MIHRQNDVIVHLVDMCVSYSSGRDCIEHHFFNDYIVNLQFP